MDCMRTIIDTVFCSATTKAQQLLSEMSASDREALEKSWDIEHAYYSSTLEGSKLDREEFEKLGELVP